MTAPLDLDTIEAREKKATVGPWFVEPENANCSSVVRDGLANLACTNPQNQAFIAAARTDVPALVAELRETRSQAAYWEAYALALITGEPAPERPDCVPDAVDRPDTGPAFEPNWASPPGDTIQDALDERSLTRAELALGIGLFEQEVDRLVSGALEINEGLAGNLSDFLGGSKQFWLNRELQYANSLARLGRVRPSCSIATDEACDARR